MRRLVIGEVNEASSNVIITSKYTFYNFIPLFLWANLNPFRKFANFYFCVIGCLQCVPSITISGGLPTTIPPLLFVLTIEAFNELRQDHQRKKADASANATNTQIFSRRKKTFEYKQWCDIKLGDVIKVNVDEIIPADILFLYSGASNRPRSAFVNTKSLDGETDNKYRQATVLTAGTSQKPNLSKEDSILKLTGSIEYEQPNSKTNDFVGTLNITNPAIVPEGEPPSCRLDENHILLRGCVLKNTEWVYGLVLSTGLDCKIEYTKSEQNKSCLPATSNKYGSISAMLNKGIKYLCALVIITCSFAACMGTFYQLTRGNEMKYIGYVLSGDTKMLAIYIITTFLRYVLLNYTFIPISLYVSLTMVYAFQSGIMARQMLEWFPKSDPEDDNPLIVRTNILNDELGQVTHIFSDKTGTLTRNRMVFRSMIVNGVTYGLSKEDDNNSSLDNFKSNMSHKAVNQFVKFIDREKSHPESLLKNVHTSGKNFFEVNNFCLNMALNHTAFIGKSPLTGDLQLNASSPDEQAFVAASYTFGWKFVSRDLENGRIVLDVDGENISYDILGVLEYTNARKRMSIICQPVGDERIILFCKGADNVIYDRLCPRKNNSSVVNKTAEQVSMWANQAMRTLVFGSKTISKSDYLAWKVKYGAALENPAQLEARKAGLKNLIDDFMDEIEQNLTLQGASAVEDELQEGVPDALGAFSEAGIKVWMITGDKVGTAKNIAVACNLLKDEKSMYLIDLTTEAMDELMMSKTDQTFHALKDLPSGDLVKIEQASILYNESKALGNKSTNASQIKNDFKKIVSELESKYKGLQEIRRLVTLSDGERNKMAKGLPLGVIIDEKIIDYTLSTMKMELLRLTQSAKSVMCARARKDQKAKMVLLVKENDPASVTLAIGDGANDVDMIRAAHIGVGVSGKEGKQAVNNSDYAISQFKCLLYLLLVHGRSNYKKISFLICYMFWKNILMAGVQYIFSIESNFSGQKFYADNITMLYGVLYTSWPIIVFAVFDRDMTPSACLSFPQLYREGLHKSFMSNARLFKWIVYSFACCFYIYYLPQYMLQYISGFHGEDPGIWDLGSICFTITVFMANVQIACETYLTSILTQLAFLICTGLWFAVFELFSSERIEFVMWKQGEYLFHSYPVLLTVLFCNVTHLYAVKALKWINIYFFPKPTYIVQELYSGHSLFTLPNNLENINISVENVTKEYNTRRHHSRYQPSIETNPLAEGMEMSIRNLQNNGPEPVFIDNPIHKDSKKSMPKLSKTSDASFRGSEANDRVESIRFIKHSLPKQRIASSHSTKSINFGNITTTVSLSHMDNLTVPTQNMGYSLDEKSSRRISTLALGSEASSGIKSPRPASSKDIHNTTRHNQKGSFIEKDFTEILGPTTKDDENEENK